MSDYDSRLRLYALANPADFAAQGATIERLVLQTLRLPPSPLRRVYISPSSGWFEYTALDELWERSTPPTLPAAPAAMKAAEELLANLERACSDANRAWPTSLRGMALFPPIAMLQRIGLHAVPRPDGSNWDHWIYRAQPRLALDGGSKTRADVFGAQIEVRIGHMGQPISVRSRWTPLSGEQQFTDLSAFRPSAAEDAKDVGSADTTAPPIRFSLDGDGIPQYYLAPYYFASDDGEYDMTSASPYSLTVAVDLTRQDKSGMTLTALARGGSGNYAYNWGVYSMPLVENGIRELGPGSTVIISNGDGRPVASSIKLDSRACIVALNVKDRATGAFKHHQQQIYPRIPVEDDVEASSSQLA